MPLTILAYILITLLASGKMMLNGSVLSGVALVAASAIGFVAGSGARGGMHMGQQQSALIIGALLLLLGAGVAFYAEVSVSIFGVELAGDVWAALGALIGFIAAKPNDAEISAGLACQRDA